MHKLEISSPKGMGATTDVRIDGEPTKGLTGLTLTLEAEDLVRAELRILAVPTEFTGEAELSLPPETAELLVKLGWTPPNG